LVEININPTATHKKLLYVSDENDTAEIVLTENNYKELAFTYMNWKNGGYKECKNCGLLFKTKKTGNQLYCKKCAPKYEPKGDVQKTCACGNIFYVDSRNMTKTMCDGCYQVYRRNKKTETMRKLREK